MSGTPSPTVRRREFGGLLRSLRNERGWTVEQVAQQLLCSPSKVSRLETGQRGASARDVRDLCDLYQVDEGQRKHLAQLAKEGKQRAWWQPLDLPYSTYVGLEAEATSISDYGIGVIPGLLQTTDYAREVVRSAVPRWVPEVVDQRVQGRIARQSILMSDSPPTFHAVIDEAVLHRVVGGPAVMRGQLSHLLEVAKLPNVSLGLVPYEAGVMPAVNKFIILGFASRTIRDVVFVEGLTGDLYLDDIEDVEAYNIVFRALSALAAGPDRTLAMIASKLVSYR